MATLHMQTETARAVAQHLKQNSETISSQLQYMQRSIQDLELAWQGRDSDKFIAEGSDLLRRLITHQEILFVLSDRLQREAQEWEDVDQRGFTAFRAGRLNSPWFGSNASFPLTAGGGPFNVFTSAILPMMSAISIAPFLSGIPGWLSGVLDRLFPPAIIISPVADTPLQPQTSGNSAFGELLRKQSIATSSAQLDTLQATASAQVATSPQNGFDLYYQVQTKSQGSLYGNAACAPTSVSMVLDYYHDQTPSLKTASTSDLIKMLDKGDGTPGSGVALDRMNDDLAELGYKNITVKTQASFEDLNSSLKDGPLIVTTGVKLVGGDVRDIQGPGNTIHAMVVKGSNAESVVLNDPWSGKELVFSRDVFSKMWSIGSNGMYVIRP